MIQHIVMLRLMPETQPETLQPIMAGLAALGAQIDGFDGFQHGPNRDFEQKSQDYPYGFVCTFADKAAVQAYAENHEHRRLGARLVALCDGGGDGIWVADIEVG